MNISTHAPAGGATSGGVVDGYVLASISTHAPAGGATKGPCSFPACRSFLLTPLREGRRSQLQKLSGLFCYFYSRPCGRGDLCAGHAPAHSSLYFYSRPCGRGDLIDLVLHLLNFLNFYSRPCGRGDRNRRGEPCNRFTISTHAPAGGATRRRPSPSPRRTYFYSRPCGRGDGVLADLRFHQRYFYSRPCGRGDGISPQHPCCTGVFLLTPLREGRHRRPAYPAFSV